MGASGISLTDVETQSAVAYLRIFKDETNPFQEGEPIATFLPDEVLLGNNYVQYIFKFKEIQ